jgi:hypothetical protein
MKKNSYYTAEKRKATANIYFRIQNTYWRLGATWICILRKVESKKNKIKTSRSERP